MNRGILVDRDGVLIENLPDYVKTIAEVRLLPGVPEAVARLWAEGFILCVVTNQAGIAKGLYSAKDVENIHSYIEEQLFRYGKGKIRWYTCPHSSTAGCSCRKPEPGLLLQALHENNLSAAETWMVGDKKSDIGAGKRASCPCCLVQTGWGESQIFTALEEQPEWILPDFSTFVAKFLQTKPFSS